MSSSPSVSHHLFFEAARRTDNAARQIHQRELPAAVKHRTAAAVALEVLEGAKEIPVGVKRVLRTGIGLERG